MSDYREEIKRKLNKILEEEGEDTSANMEPTSDDNLEMPHFMNWEPYNPRKKKKHE